MSAHTHGPWHIEGNMVVSNYAPRRVWGDNSQYSGKFIVCQPHMYVSAEGGELEANTRLIAAAPELLEALTDALCALEVCGRNFDHVMGKARDAIAKAKGESV